MDQEKVKLTVMGISYNPLQSNAFAMLLAEENGPYRIPVVIGSAEAQSIAIQLEKIITPRPMTHDLFSTFAQAYGVQLLEVFIYKFEDGAFFAELKLTDGVTEVTIDSRTSDAVAIALRMNAPIYTTREVLNQTGVKFDIDEISDQEADTQNVDADTDESIESLESKLSKCIEDEDYEEAARISKILKNKKKNQ